MSFMLDYYKCFCHHYIYFINILGLTIVISDTRVKYSFQYNAKKSKLANIYILSTVSISTFLLSIKTKNYHNSRLVGKFMYCITCQSLLSYLDIPCYCDEVENKEK